MCNFTANNNDQELNIVAELEKVINIASSTIESIQGQLDKERAVNCSIQNEYRALALNKVLLSRQELLTQQIMGL